MNIISSPRGSAFTSLILLATVLFICAAYLSKIVKDEVLEKLNNPASRSGTVIYGAPAKVFTGQNLEAVQLMETLQRLNYRESSAPTNAGEYSYKDQTIKIVTRPTKAEADTVTMQLTANGTISKIESTRRGELSELELEPEIVATVGGETQQVKQQRKLSDFSPLLIDAILAVEDERFYYHFGIDPIGIGRALQSNITSGAVVQGGSTLTQQVAKNLFFSSKRTIVRKILEAITAVLIEIGFTKDQILEMYLNEVFLGQEGNFSLHGFPEATRSFFGKDIADLDLSEAALLAGLVKAPSKLSPRRNPENAKARRDVVLTRMFELGKISEGELKKAKAAAVRTLPPERNKRRAPYFVDYIIKRATDLGQSEDLTTANLKIFTGLNLDHQLCAEEVLGSFLHQLEKSHPNLRSASSPLQGALVSVDVVSGAVTAWAGGRSYAESQFDRVSLSKRQPGSSFKPFVYLTALDGSLNSYKIAKTTSVLTDEPVQIELPDGSYWEPKNFDDGFRGDVTVREALAFSLNIPTVQLAQRVGISAIKRTAKLFGFGDDLPEVPSLALGAGEVSPLQLARAYLSIANGGVISDPKSITGITTNDKNATSYTVEYPEVRVANEAPVFVLTTVLQDVINYGTGTSIRRLGFTGPAAGKTGTTNDSRDAWFAGFTPRTLAVVWVGFDDNRVLGLTGGQAAAPIWASFMKCISGSEPQLDFVSPPGVVYKRIDRQNGLVATAYCPRAQVIQEIFVQGTEPTTTCDLH